MWANANRSFIWCLLGAKGAPNRILALKQKQKYFYASYIFVSAFQASASNTRRTMKPTKSWFHCSSVWSRNFFSAYFFETFHHWYRRFYFHYYARRRSQVYNEKFSKGKCRKTGYFSSGWTSLSDTDYLYMFHYNGEVVSIIYGDIINLLGPIRISFSP